MTIRDTKPPLHPVLQDLNWPLPMPPESSWTLDKFSAPGTPSLLCRITLSHSHDLDIELSPGRQCETELVEQLRQRVLNAVRERCLTGQWQQPPDSPGQRE